MMDEFMIFRVLSLVVLTLFSGAAPALAQQQAWVQIEAQPTLREAQDRARGYAAALPDVAGFQIATGWYAVTLGPYTVAEAAGQLYELKRQGLIPRDSFVTDGGRHQQQFWPIGQASVLFETAPEPPEVFAAPEALPEVEVGVQIEVETLAEARAAEAELSREERMALQEALAWYGAYTGKIDGSFGRGTRASIAAWQAAAGFEETGVLSTDQRGILTSNHQADLAEFGFERMAEPEAGIEMTLPMAMLQFDHYEPPFVHFSAKNGSDLRVILISEPGDKATLFGLYDILQTLEVVPADGARSRGERSFSINAASDSVESYAYAELKDGAVKGYLVVWKPADAARMARILPLMQASFASTGAKALDPGLVPLDDTARAGLLSGLEVKMPKLSRSGFYVDAKGDVVTTIEAVAQCGRVTIDTDTEAAVLAQDASSGLAILRPKQALAPEVFARLQAAPPRAGAQISVAGYSYEGKLPAPVLTLGSLAETVGLNGEAGVARLSLPLLPGDAGGPVLDATGSVIGMVLAGVKTGAKVLPEGVAFAVQAPAIAQALLAAGISAQMSDVAEIATPDALSATGMGMTVLVSCWE
jgi:peptidoglycan hydrolase-like protein with peptidoglycan-binding domain